MKYSLAVPPVGNLFDRLLMVIVVVTLFPSALTLTLPATMSSCGFCPVVEFTDTTSLYWTSSPAGSVNAGPHGLMFGPAEPPPPPPELGGAAMGGSVQSAGWM